MTNSRATPWIIVFLLVLVAGTFWVVKHLEQKTRTVGFAKGNGRIEAKEVDIATKYAGRVAEVGVEEGDAVRCGQVLARLDTKEEEAQLRVAEAELLRMQQGLRYAQDMQTVAEHELGFARRELDRSLGLIEKSNISRERLDQDKTHWQQAQSQLQAARARVGEAGAAVQAARAEKERIETIIREASLLSPRNGRVLYRLAEPGEVLEKGGKALTVIDLSDVYMTLFLPEAEAGKLVIGADARIVLDSLRDLPFPAKVSFVSPHAQFTPKQVETANEREKLAFRIKARVDAEFLKVHSDLVKTGMPGVAYVRLDSSVPWPEHLR